jgi:hypothetical protein
VKTLPDGLTACAPVCYNKDATQAKEFVHRAGRSTRECATQWLEKMQDVKKQPASLVQWGGLLLGRANKSVMPSAPESSTLLVKFRAVGATIDMFLNIGHRAISRNLFSAISKIM